MSVDNIFNLMTCDIFVMACDIFVNCGCHGYFNIKVEQKDRQFRAVL